MAGKQERIFKIPETKSIRIQKLVVQVKKYGIHNDKSTVGSVSPGNTDTKYTYWYANCAVSTRKYTTRKQMSYL